MNKINKQQILTWLTRYPYLSRQAKVNLHQYHYVSSDASFMSQVLNPFWEKCAQLLPKNMAPNMVTLLGFIGVILSFVITIILNPKLDRPVSSWVYVLSAFCMFFYQTMDAIDGKHARNIKAGSVLGELFDHGVDAVVTLLMAIVACGTFQSGATYSTVIVIFMLYFASFLIIWEDYLTDTLRFGKYNGPTEGILFVVGILLLTALAGPGIWTFSVMYSVRINTLFVVLFCVGSISAIVEAVKMVKTVSQKVPPVERFKAINGLVGARQSVLPFVVQLVFFTIYAWFASNIVYNHPISLAMSYGLSSAYIQTRLVFARATKERTPEWYVIQLPLPLLVLSAIYFQYGSLFLHYSYLLYIIAVYAHFVYNGIVELTKVLGIEAFSIVKHAPVPEGFGEIKWT